jgi:RNA polymerase sigma-70 factor (sigma-E family)
MDAARGDRPDPEAEFREFVAARWTALARYAYLFTGDHGHAEDLVQQALEQCWRRWRKVRINAPEAYVRASIAHAAAARWRRRRVLETSWDAVTDRAGELRGGGTPSSSDPGTSHAERSQLWLALAELPPRMRAVVVLRIWEDLSEAQTARVLGCSVGTVKSQLSRALTRLRAEGAAHGLIVATPTANQSVPTTANQTVSTTANQIGDPS